MQNYSPAFNRFHQIALNFLLSCIVSFPILRIGWAQHSKAPDQPAGTNAKVASLFNLMLAMPQLSLEQGLEPAEPLAQLFH